MTIFKQQIPAAYGLSISDDDICSNCQFCVYNAGELSFCKKNWPCEPDEDLQIRTCPEFASEHPCFCPFCGTQLITTADIIWESRSTDPCDRDNTADLTEYQCDDCARSFWV